MARGGTSHDRILNAAAELAVSEGAAHLSLDAVAARAGVSKGGLLYNFPNKAALMQGLVERFIELFRSEIEESAGEGHAGRLAPTYLSIVLRNLDEKLPRSSGLLAVLAENPCMMEPVKAFHRDLLDRLLDEASDPGAVLVLFMVLEGLRAQRLLGTDILEPEERSILLVRINSLLGEE